jgi:feruloyl esterase
VIEAYYGKAPEKSYFQGCSTGGRMALMEAWKYPEDFDGIICSAPAMDYTGLVGTFFAWLVQANTGPDGKDIITPTKVELIQKAVYKQCDKLDGIADGLIDDPRKCDFDPAIFRCPPGQSADDCLTETVVDTLEAWYGGARNSAGKTAWGQKIVYPYISVLGMEEQDVPGIVIPEKKVGIDGLLGRSFLKRFVVCFDYEQGPKIQLTPKKP